MKSLSNLYGMFVRLGLILCEFFLLVSVVEICWSFVVRRLFANFICVIKSFQEFLYYDFASFEQQVCIILCGQNIKICLSEKVKSLYSILKHEYVIS